MPAGIEDDLAPPMRVLIASHSHPRVLSGGSEVASYSLFQHLQDHDGFKAWYCGCTRSASFGRSGQSITQPFERDEYLYTVGDFEGFKFANRDMAFARDFRALLRNLRPDIVHFHHYVNFGMEAFAYVKEVVPEASIILTLHEFLAICHQQGQMVTRQQGKLCRRSGYVECSRCFPEMQPSDFFLRETYIRHFFRHVDRFVAPSAFLARRYIEWGIDPDRISVIENVPTRSRAAEIVPRTSVPGELRVGFFGQISVLKGIMVLIEAAAILEQEQQSDIELSIFGDYTNQPAAFQAEFLARVEKFGNNIAFHGAYNNSDVDELMSDIDVVVVPSIWWENSPVVIQEALRNGRPVVCSNVGGMAEKVVAGEDGLHFQVGSARSLANVLKGLAANPELLDKLGRGASRERDYDVAMARHLRLYRDVRPVASETEAPPQRAAPDRPIPSFAVP
ncbi:glycosyltransferase family 4 protein [Lichenicola sp.]|uniref:glycosyltransferase family 4 protein n=1 Tax=Lichenicola sp. TaxID=2804529 RepID=UPI003B00A9B9